MIEAEVPDQPAVEPRLGEQAAGCNFAAVVTQVESSIRFLRGWLLNGLRDWRFSRHAQLFAGFFYKERAKLHKMAVLITQKSDQFQALGLLLMWICACSMIRRSHATL